MAAKVKRFRLILSDGLPSGSQTVRTFDGRPATIEEVIGLLNSHFSFKDVCSKLGLPVGGGQLRFQGLDGPRRIPLKANNEMVAFFSSLQHTSLPTIEVRLPTATSSKTSPTALAASAVSVDDASRRRGRDPRDHVEELEDANFKMMRAAEKVERRLTELERILATNEERNQRIIDVAKRDLITAQEKALKSMQVQVDALHVDDEKILQDLDVVRKHSLAVEQKDLAHHEELLEQLDAFGRRVNTQFDDVSAEIDALKAEDNRLDVQANTTKEEHQQQFDDHLAELQRLEEAKVNVDKWRKEEDAMTERITEELAALAQQLKDEVSTLTNRLGEEVSTLTNRLGEFELDTHNKFEEETSTRKADDESISRLLSDTTQRLDGALQTTNSALEAGLRDLSDRLKAAHTELSTSTKAQVLELSTKTEQRFTVVEASVAAKDAAFNKKIEELTGRSEKTFQGLNERLEEMLRVERVRLGAIERDHQESCNKLRSDFRAEIERVRGDYEQETARADLDLGDLHTKYDVTKQEINFFNTRLKEQREWTECRITEAATATRAAALDSQEGLAATTKMLNALRDDAVRFREKMAKYISLLQHSSDSQGDTVNLLETHRMRMRAELDALIGDHRAYTSDMDSWADDVRVKVERIFRALEPARVEWRVPGVLSKAKDMKRPLAVKSPSFTVKGLRDARLEFFPDGTSSSPDGKAVLRLLMPSTANLKYQIWVGASSDGAHEHRQGGNLTKDMLIEHWKEEIGHDGSLPVVLEVLRDFNNDDSSLSRELRIETD